MKLHGLKVGAVRLALALVLALLVVPGFVVAPVLFTHLESHAMAGHLAGIIFHIGNVTILILLLAVALFWQRYQVRKPLAWWCLLALGLLISINEFGITPIMETLKSAMGSIDALPVDDPKRATFGMWHGISEILHLAAVAVVAYLVAVDQIDT